MLTMIYYKRYAEHCLLMGGMYGLSLVSREKDPVCLGLYTVLLNGDVGLCIIQSGEESDLIISLSNGTRYAKRKM